MKGDDCDAGVIAGYYTDGAVQNRCCLTLRSAWYA
jgi:hypothetical protein